MAERVLRSDRDLAKRVSALKKKLGSALPEGDARGDELLQEGLRSLPGHGRWLKRDRRLVGALLAHATLPPCRWRGWLVRASSVGDEIVAALSRHRQANGLIDRRVVRGVLKKQGVAPAYRDDLMQHLGRYRKADEGWVECHGNIADRAIACLRFHERPMDAKEIGAWLGIRNTSSLRSRLHADGRVIRINARAQFVLEGTPGHTEYQGAVAEMKKEIRRRGGKAPAEVLVPAVARRCGVKPSSVETYLLTRQFVRDPEGLIMIRGENGGSGEVEPRRPLAYSARCYRRRGSWIFAIPVTGDILRGSGHAIADAFAAMCGCEWGKKITLRSRYGEIGMSWPKTAVAGASVGTLAAVASGLDAVEGDYIFVGYLRGELSFERLDETLIAAASDPLEKLALLVGMAQEEAKKGSVAAIARAVGMFAALSGMDSPTIEDVHRWLVRRSEPKLASLALSVAQR